MHNKKVIPLAITFIVLALGLASIFYASTSRSQKAPEEVRVAEENPVLFMIGSVLEIEEKEMRVSGAMGEKVVRFDKDTEVVKQMRNGTDFTVTPAVLADIALAQPIMVFYSEKENPEYVAQKIQILGF